jgi:hypothetical protein
MKCCTMCWKNKPNSSRTQTLFTRRASSGSSVSCVSSAIVRYASFRAVTFAVASRAPMNCTTVRIVECPSLRNSCSSFHNSSVRLSSHFALHTLTTRALPRVLPSSRSVIVTARSNPSVCCIADEQQQLRCDGAAAESADGARVLVQSRLQEDSGAAAHRTCKSALPCTFVRLFADATV